MALVLPALQLQNLCRRYEAGESVKKLCGELGVTDKVVQRLLKSQGVSLRDSRAAKSLGRGFSDDDVGALHARYMAGESSVELAATVGCHSLTLRNAFRRHGLPVRDASSAHTLSAARMTPEQRAAMTASAHDAVRGRKVSIAERSKTALTREANPPELSPAEARVLLNLESFGVHVQRERACGPYNIDFAVNRAVAVECFGGGWHASAHHAARHEKRTRYLLDAGWDVVIVWIDERRHGGWVRALKKVIADLQRPGRDPSALREYRVIWGDGEQISLRADADHFPDKPPGEVRRDTATGRYYRAG